MYYSQQISDMTTELPTWDARSNEPAGLTHTCFKTWTWSYLPAEWHNTTQFDTAFYKWANISRQLSSVNQICLCPTHVRQLRMFDADGRFSCQTHFKVFVINCAFVTSAFSVYRWLASGMGTKCQLNSQAVTRRSVPLGK